MSIVLGCTILLTGFVSFLNHGSNIDIGTDLEMGSLYLALSVMNVITLVRLIPLPTVNEDASLISVLQKCRLSSFIGIILGLLIATARILPVNFATNAVTELYLLQVMFAVTLVGSVMIRRFHARSWAYLFTSAFSISLGIFFFVADDFPARCNFVFGHAIWHLLSAFFLISAYLFMRSETIPGRIIRSKSQLEIIPQSYSFKSSLSAIKLQKKSLQESNASSKSRRMSPIRDFLILSPIGSEITDPHAPVLIISLESADRGQW